MHCQTGLTLYAIHCITSGVIDVSVGHFSVSEGASSLAAFGTFLAARVGAVVRSMGFRSVVMLAPPQL